MMGKDFERHCVILFPIIPFVRGTKQKQRDICTNNDFPLVLLPIKCGRLK